MSDITTLSEKFQISVPKAVRETQGWRPGQKLVFIPKGAGVMLMPAPTAEDLFGLGQGASPEGCRDRDDRF
jgi:AbrB family looped-hinge helix DNA binding protein